MTWLVSKQEKDSGARLRELIEKEDILPVPGVFNPMTALIAKKIGFKSVYLSGAAITASLGMPDLGLITLTELSSMVRYIYRASNLPIIVDADVGFGEVLNLVRTVKEMEEAGAAAIQIEDQEFTKRCGHLPGKRVIPSERMAQKIAVARKARENLLIIARTDARSVNGIEDAIERAKLYVKAGADIIFPEALKNEEEFEKFAKKIDVPLLANMTEFGETPYISVQRFKKLGYKIVIFPVTTLRIANKAVEEVLKLIMETGTQKPMLDRMQTRKELYKILKYYDYEAIDRKVSELML